MGIFLARIEAILKQIVIVLIGFMLAVVFLLVCSRYLFSYTPSFGEELARYLFVWIVFLSLPIVTASGGHLAIKAVAERLHGRARFLVNLLAALCSLALMTILTYQSLILLVNSSYQTTPALGISISFVYLAMPVGCGIMTLQLVHAIGKLFNAENK